MARAICVQHAAFPRNNFIVLGSSPIDPNPLPVAYAVRSIAPVAVSFFKFLPKYILKDDGVKDAGAAGHPVGAFMSTW